MRSAGTFNEPSLMEREKHLTFSLPKTKQRRVLLKSHAKSSMSRSISVNASMSSPKKKVFLKRYSFFREYRDSSPLSKAVLFGNSPRPRSTSMDVRERCCLCPASLNRCSTADCPCYSAGKTCNERCETVRLKANCMNQTIARCFCIRQPNHAKGKPEIIHCNTSRCECVAYHEPCTLDCLCNKDCPHRTNPYTTGKLLRPSKGCKCGGGKKSCSKAKCTCRQTLDHCGSGCKCQGNCTNTPSFQISNVARSCFSNPEQETTAIVMKLSGQEYQYQMDFCSGEKGSHPEEALYETLINAVSRYPMSLNHITLFMSKSPCYHQDCEPRCEVLEHCEMHRACARLLRAVLFQSQKHLGHCALNMVVKFLCPYVKRGDLYTKQAILCLMEAGISVEPLSLREWGELMQDQNENLGTSVQLSLWTAANMDRHIRASQHYINQCRRALGLHECMWTSNFHELLKVTILTCGQTQFWLDKLAKQLDQIEQPWYSISEEMSHSLHATLERSTSGNLKTQTDSPKSGSGTLKRSQSKDKDHASTGKGSLSKATGVAKKQGSIDLSESMQSLEAIRGGALAGSERALALECMLTNFTSRSMSEIERNEIKAEIALTVERLQKDIGNLMQFLERKSTENDHVISVQQEVEDKFAC